MNNDPDDTSNVEAVAIAEALRPLLTNSKRRELVKQALGLRDNKPLNWMVSSNAPYYKEVYAIWIQRTIDAMLADNKDRFFACSKMKTRRNTLYQQVNQAWRYLIDKLDTPDKTYAKARELIIVRRVPNGILLKLAPTIADLDMPDISEGDEFSDDNEWRVELDEFISKAPDGSIFHHKDVFISNEEIAGLEASFISLDNIVYRITNTEIKVIKKLPNV